ncbi:hypothetical protein EVAR_86691_1 [Eumeta japonica]|uniref:Uncharacterized protein n=1 Tax=Eumeta variegata TaxID=151549 RepID=A0A4C1Y0B8_EUMVA|nr:hypothetical protein EVAR_86691_1 [Eumeta japonica]
MTAISRSLILDSELGAVRDSIFHAFDAGAGSTLDFDPDPVFGSAPGPAFTLDSVTGHASGRSQGTHRPITSTITILILSCLRRAFDSYRGPDFDPDSGLLANMA